MHAFENNRPTNKPMCRPKLHINAANVRKQTIHDNNIILALY